MKHAFLAFTAVATLVFSVTETRSETVLTASARLCVDTELSLVDRSAQFADLGWTAAADSQATERAGTAFGTYFGRGLSLYGTDLAAFVEREQRRHANLVTTLGNGTDFESGILLFVLTDMPGVLSFEVSADMSFTCRLLAQDAGEDFDGFLNAAPFASVMTESLALNTFRMASTDRDRLGEIREERPHEPWFAINMSLHEVSRLSQILPGAAPETNGLMFEGIMIARRPTS